MRRKKKLSQKGEEKQGRIVGVEEWRGREGKHGKLERREDY